MVTSADVYVQSLSGMQFEAIAFSYRCYTRVTTTPVIDPSQQLIDLTTLTKYHLLYCLQDVKLYSLFHNGTQHRSVWLAINEQVDLVCVMSSCYMH